MDLESEGWNDWASRVDLVSQERFQSADVPVEGHTLHAECQSLLRGINVAKLYMLLLSQHRVRPPWEGVGSDSGSLGGDVRRDGEYFLQTQR